MTAERGADLAGNAHPSGPVTRTQQHRHDEDAVVGQVLHRTRSEACFAQVATNCSGGR